MRVYSHLEWVYFVFKGAIFKLLLLLSVICVPCQKDGGIHPTREIENAYVLPTPSNEWITFEEAHKNTPSLYTKKVYLELLDAFKNSDPDLPLKLREAYRPLQNQPYLETTTHTLSYPSLKILALEDWITHLPAAIILAALYGASALFFPLFYPAFGLHCLLILLRCIVLKRPPVSSMEETLIFVPWVVILSALILLRQRPLLKIAAALSCVMLFFLPRELSFGSLQAVLNSNFYLAIHVLMVVASYGLFILSGTLAHLALIRPSKDLTQPILKLTYSGLVLLVGGTLLGGVWAMNSWGRFWDWDPKESWAFISIVSYLLLVHAYKYRIIGKVGLYNGAILGLIAITFTWYGVNYILGTGMHSYGFGHGGEKLYLLFIVIELLFLISMKLFTKNAGLKKKSKNSKPSELHMQGEEKA